MQEHSWLRRHDLVPAGSQEERRAWARRHLVLTFLWCLITFGLASSAFFSVMAAARGFSVMVGLTFGMIGGFVFAVTIVVIIRSGWTIERPGLPFVEPRQPRDRDG